MNRGGAETLILNVYRNIDRSQVQFDFVVHTRQPGHYDEEIIALGGRILPHPSPNRVGIRAYGHALLKTLHEQGPFRGVHSHVHYFSGWVLRMAEKAGVPLRLAHSHTSNNSESKPYPRKAYRWYMRWLIYRNATHLLGCSRLACEALFGPNCWSNPAVKLIHDAIDLMPYKMLPNNRYVYREKLSLPREAILVGHVGRFEPPKNHRFLIEVFTELLQKLPTAHLVLVGDGVLRPEIERQIDSKGIQDKVHFLGIRSDIPQILGCLDLFLFPSLWEGFGIALIEAQAAGVPCVASDVITNEANLNVGLLQFVDLQAGIEVWRNRILQGLQSDRPDWHSRELALQRAGLDIHQTSRLLLEIYASGE
jgi:glycosyltransferase involved in cell wall biosynthesis